MSEQSGSQLTDAFRRFATAAAASMGSSWAFALSIVVVVIWAATGPLFKFSDTWQLIINTGTTIVTFLMVFLIQATQNRDSRAIHLKLDELLRSIGRARNTIVGIENMSDEEMEEFEQEFRALRLRQEERRRRKRSDA